MDTVNQEEDRAAGQLFGRRLNVLVYSTIRQMLEQPERFPLVTNRVITTHLEERYQPCGTVSRNLYGRVMENTKNLAIDGLIVREEFRGSRKNINYKITAVK